MYCKPRHRLMTLPNLLMLAALASSTVPRCPEAENSARHLLLVLILLLPVCIGGLSVSSPLALCVCSREILNLFYERPIDVAAPEAHNM